MSLEYPSPTEVDRIAALTDPVLRNLLITQSYHELSRVLADRLGGANWCTFATWASKQAGQTIRKEDLSRALEYSLRQGGLGAHDAARAVALAARALGAAQPIDEIQRRIWELLNPAAALERASTAIARGNLKVFAEIAREFARFFDALLDDTTFDAERITRFVQALRDGDPPEGQHYLRRAFTRCYQCFFEADPVARAQLLHLANIEIGFHEQTRLQPEIQDAVEAVVPDATDISARLLADLFPARGWLVRARLFWNRLIGRPTPFETAVQAFVDASRKGVRFFITQHLMTLEIPVEVRLSLGRDLRATFPVALARISNADLLEFLARIDPTPDSVRDSGAADWVTLTDRMHFIADFFRAYHQAPELLNSPFSLDQITELKAGRMPPGRL